MRFGPRRFAMGLLGAGCDRRGCDWRVLRVGLVRAAPLQPSGDASRDGGGVWTQRARGRDHRQLQRRLLPGDRCRSSAAHPRLRGRRVRDRGRDLRLQPHDPQLRPGSDAGGGTQRSPDPARNRSERRGPPLWQGRVSEAGLERNSDGALLVARVRCQARRSIRRGVRRQRATHSPLSGAIDSEGADTPPPAPATPRSASGRSTATLRLALHDHDLLTPDGSSQAQQRSTARGLHRACPG